MTWKELAQLIQDHMTYDELRNDVTIKDASGEFFGIVDIDVVVESGEHSDVLDPGAHFLFYKS